MNSFLIFPETQDNLQIWEAALSVEKVESCAYFAY